VRDALRRIDLPPEGCLVLDDGRSLPLDAPLDRPRRLQIVPTHSGG
jgi:sulfur carrier protein ThiS